MTCFGSGNMSGETTSFLGGCFRSSNSPQGRARECVAEGLASPAPRQPRRAESTPDPQRVRTTSELRVLLHDLVCPDSTQVRSTTCKSERTELPICVSCVSPGGVSQANQTNMSRAKRTLGLLPSPPALLPLQFSILADTCAHGKPLVVIPDPSSCPTSTSNATSKTFQICPPPVPLPAASLLQASHVSCLDQQP